MPIQWSTIVVAEMFSSVTATFISAYFVRRLERNKAKRDCARRLFAYRFSMESNEFNAALNEIKATFDDDKKVIAALQGLHANLGTSKSNAALALLFRETMRSAGMKRTTETDSYYFDFLHIPKQH